MTEKRFHAAIDEDNCIEYIQDFEAYEYINFADFVDLANLLARETDKLKSIIHDVIEVLEEADLFSDKSVKHDTIAYKELMTMDNKDALLIAVNTKKAIKQLKEVIK